MTQETRNQLQTNINTNLADNNTGDISAADSRINMIDITDSVVFPEDTPSIVNVSQLGDFPTPVANKITLDSSHVYHIHGTVDIGANSLVVPEGGASISAPSGARDVSVLTSSEDGYSMFESPAGGYSGNVVMSGVTITADGVGSGVFDLTNDENGHALDILNVNFTSCTNLGSLTDYRQLLLSDCGFIFIDDGLTFNGTWSGGVAAITSIAIGFPASATMFKEGTSLTFAGSVRSDMNFLSVDATSTFMDFQESNILADEGVTLTGFRTSADDAMPNLSSSSTKVRYSNCFGIRDTYIGGEYSVTTASATTITSSNTLVKMAGTTTYDDLQWFTGSNSNELVYDSDQEIEVEVKGTLGFTGGNGDEMGLQVRQWDDSASAYVDIGSRYIQTFSGNGSIESLTFFARATINNGDRIEVWIENQSDTSNITANVGGFVGVSER